MMNHITNLKSIKNREDILEYCGWTMNHIGSGTGRSVFEISDELVIKVARNEAGRRQNEVEVGINHKICAITYQHSDNFDWSVMERLYPFKETDFDHLTGTTYLDRVVWCEFKAIDNGRFTPDAINKVKDRYTILSLGNDKESKNEWNKRMEKNLFSNNLVNLILSNDLEAGDLIRYDSWGFSKKNPDKPILFDYGLSYPVYSECYKRYNTKLKIGLNLVDYSIVEPIDELDKRFIKVKFNFKNVIGEKLNH